MKLCVHRGTSEIGGNCIEVEAAGKSILLDLGMPLMGDIAPTDAMPSVPGLTDGTNPDLLAIVISHPHADHYGLASKAHVSIPVYIGAEAHKLLRAAVIFTPFGVDFPNVVHYRHAKPFEIGPFRLTPYLVDHSAFDAHALLVEADGKRVFYSGDLRGHGWKSRHFNDLVTNGPTNIDLMLLEGTTLGRDTDRRSETEAALVERIAASITETRGLVFAAFAGQNIDRFVTFFKATQGPQEGGDAVRSSQTHPQARPATAQGTERRQGRVPARRHRPKPKKARQTETGTAAECAADMTARAKITSMQTRIGHDRPTRRGNVRY